MWILFCVGSERNYWRLSSSAKRWRSRYVHAPRGRVKGGHWIRAWIHKRPQRWGEGGGRIRYQGGSGESDAWNHQRWQSGGRINQQASGGRGGARDIHGGGTNNQRESGGRGEQRKNKTQESRKAANRLGENLIILIKRTRSFLFKLHVDYLAYM